MIVSLRVHNIALIEELTLEFASGLHVLTGETGAGKSIVVDAVNLVLGGRADRDLIRTGEEKAWVEAVFEEEKDGPLAAFLRERDIEYDGMVTLYREMTRSGRNLCRLCGVIVPLNTLREAAALLMDVHGQHEGRFLMDPAYHLQFLDASGGEKHQELLRQTAEAYEAFMVNHRAYVRLVKGNEQKEARLTELKKSLEELEKAKLKPGEEETLSAEKERCRHAEKIASAVSTAYGALAAGEDGSAALPRVKEAVTALQGLAELGESYESLVKRTESAYYELEEVSYELAKVQESDIFDPQRLEKIETRLDLIRRMERKYGETVEDVLAAQAQMREQYDQLASMDDQIASMGQEHKRLLAAYRAAARQLTASRQALAEAFEAGMMRQLSDLGMGATRFRVGLTPRSTGKPSMPRPDGDDEVEFLISPNPGEPLKPLARIASGGELSRLMLAIKSLEAESGGVSCMVFDEIDTGISGRMAQVVAEKMAHIARARQVLCVTHLPQIAAMAAWQFLVEKRVEGERTNTSVRLLTQEERIGEVARMLGGADGSGESAKTHAAHMLDMAQQFREEVKEN